MCNSQPKNKDWIVPDFITVDMGDVCIECYQDTSFGSGYFVNRLPADRMVEDDDGNEASKPSINISKPKPRGEDDGL